eukprot:TRINITY_DN1596_c0_g1_i1.p1 TRINITY_DN1596_c0_g1~~TRINITY_DN1596_c0_g1_i1.p1  ORF type:complete len:747 (-),score=168.90 TRINITY_DN1596_c0_g1_i1:3-2243(-)
MSDSKQQEEQQKNPVQESEKTPEQKSEKTPVQKSAKSQDKKQQQNQQNKQQNQNQKNKNQQPKKGKQQGKTPFKIENFPVPEYVQQRIDVWDRIKRDQKKGEEKPIKITLPDGSSKDGIAHKTTPYEIAQSISQGLANSVLVAKINDSLLWDLNRPLESDCRLQLLKFDAPEAQKVFWHSSAHLLGQALERKYHCKLCVGPPLKDGGFYYDMAVVDKVVTSEDYDDIKNIVNIIVKESQPFERLEVSKEDAIEMFKYSKYKVEMISKKVADGSFCSVYRCGPLIDLCKGPHIPHTGKVKAFHVYQNSSSYWLGDAKNDALQRVYGISFPDPKQLKEWLNIREEAEKRDHRKLGQKQSLFFFHPLSPGSCFFLPHGARIYNKLQAFMRAEYQKRGYTEVVTPNIFNKELWEISGHWENYKDDMFIFKCEDVDYGLKPMNCPGHCLMFKHEARSYRELPIRFADFGVLHRNELSGSLTGLTRVRKFQQDDAHIFCTHDQIKPEIFGVIDFMKHVYSTFGFSFSLELSTRPEKFLGEIQTWNDAEAALREVLDLQFPGAWKENPGDGAFYGPKIDVHVSDALKRSFQCATIQLDFQLPRRFELKYVKSDQSEGTPVIIHRALFGSVERFFAILIEHLAGRWPFWLSPRQLIVMSVAQSAEDYAREVYNHFHSAGFYVDLDVSDRTLPKKVFDAETSNYNFMLVVGEKEKKEGTVNVRHKLAEGETKPKEEIKKLSEAEQFFLQLVKEFK